MQHLAAEATGETVLAPALSTDTTPVRDPTGTQPLVARPTLESLAMQRLTFSEACAAVQELLYWQEQEQPKEPSPSEKVVPFDDAIAASIERIYWEHGEHTEQQSRSRSEDLTILTEPCSDQVNRWLEAVDRCEKGDT